MRKDAGATMNFGILRALAKSEKENDDQKPFSQIMID